MKDLILIEHPADGVRLLRLNRPDKLNAFDAALRKALILALDAAEADPAARVVLLAGGPKAFVAGADLSEVAEADPLSMAGAGLHQVWDRLERFGKPLLAAVEGFALGAGCELAMACDILVVGEGATLGQPEICVGIQPGAGGLARLVRLVGHARAMRLVLAGERIDGRQAAAWGLASDAVPDGAAEARALDLAIRIAALPAARAMDIKRVARLGQDLPLTGALALERQAYWQSFGTPDQREGMAAFLQRRPARFNAGGEP